MGNSDGGGRVWPLLKLACGDQQVRDHLLSVSGAAHGAAICDERGGGVGGGANGDHPPRPVRVGDGQEVPARGVRVLPRDLHQHEPA